MARLEESFGAPVLEAYAMTEASHQMSSNPLPEDGGHKPGSVGKPMGQEMAVLDVNGVPQREGLSGEVCIRGPNVTKGYKNNPEANKAAFSFGWFHTGDIGLFDSDGYLHLVGRIKELINRGGIFALPTSSHFNIFSKFTKYLTVLFLNRIINSSCNSFGF